MSGAGKKTKKGTAGSDAAHRRIAHECGHGTVQAPTNASAGEPQAPYHAPSSRTAHCTPAHDATMLLGTQLRSSAVPP